MSDINSYASMLNRFYSSGTTNHEIHNENPDYFNILLKEITNKPENWINKSALDFGCGKGRNVSNLLKITNWKNVDGIDISQNNIDFCIKNIDASKSKFYKNDGINLNDLKTNHYDFVMSTIVFQHICVHELRIKLKKEIFRILKNNGLFSFQMGFDRIKNKNNNYFDNNYKAISSNGDNDVGVNNENDLIDDLKEIGFKNISFSIAKSWSDDQHKEWIYVSCYK